MAIEMAGGAWEGYLEIRQEGRRPVLTGRFPYGATATIADRGRVRKERFMPHAFRYAIEVAKPLQEAFAEGFRQAAQQRQIDLLLGHSYNRPLASTRTGTLQISDTAAAVEFRATLPPASEQPTWVQDAIFSVQGGLMQGVSPGFSIPPANVVSKAEELIAEAADTDVMIRQINHAVLHEFSLVTRPSYRETSVDLRAHFRAQGEEPAIETRGDTLARLIREVRDERGITNADLAAAGGDRRIDRAANSIPDRQSDWLSTCGPSSRIRQGARRVPWRVLLPQPGQTAASTQTRKRGRLYGCNCWGTGSGLAVVGRRFFNPPGTHKRNSGALVGSCGSVHRTFDPERARRDQERMHGALFRLSVRSADDKPRRSL